MAKYCHARTTNTRRIIKPSMENAPNKTLFSHKVKNASVFLWDNLNEFTSTTTLHGFKYLLNKKYTWIERTWWLIMVICSGVLCAIFIEKNWTHRNKTPVVLKYDDSLYSIWKIPFPAVTICSETKVWQSGLNYSKAFYERWCVPPTIDQEHLKLYYDALLVCDNDKSDGPNFVDVNSLETLRKFSPSSKQMFFDCLWGNYTCDQMFYPILTKEGYCFTFNMLSPEDMFRMENLHKDYLHAYGTNKSSFWTLGTGYASNAPIHTYPLRGMSYTGVEFEVILLTDFFDLDPLCHGPTHGFKIWLYNPAELPTVTQKYFKLPIMHQLTASLKPKATFTSYSIRKYPPNKRNCYFPDERYLKYFQTYTEQNCELECAINFTEKHCGCVPPSMPHGPSTRLCGGGKAQCILQALDMLSLIKPLSNAEADEDNPGCLQSLFGNAFMSNAGWITGKKGQFPSGLILYFGEDRFTSIQRSELYSFVEFLAHCGGFMSVFLGFSFLSLAEVVFFMTLRLWSRIRKQKVSRNNQIPQVLEKF